jgi:predicted transcriptional regulator of viral defense system
MSGENSLNSEFCLRGEYSVYLRAQVLHALLVHQHDWFGVTEVAEKAQVAPSTASDVLSQLDRFDWLVSRGPGAE